MNLSIILEFPWFKKWEITTTLYLDLKQWCWFDHYYTKGSFDDENSVAKQLGFESHAKWFEFDVSVLCFSFMVEGMKS